MTQASPGARILMSVNTSWNVFNFRGGLIRALVAAGHEVVVAAPEDDYSNRLREFGCRHVPLPMDNKGTSPVKDLALLMRYRRLFARERPHVYLGYTIKPNIYGSLAARMAGIPAINNISGLGTAFIRDTWLTRLVKMLYTQALAPASTVFFQNGDDHGLFVDQGMVKAEKTALLPGSGIDLSRYPAAPMAQNPAPVFLLIARLLRDKGVVEFVDAARAVKARFPDARFQLLGFLDVENRTAITREEVDGWVREGVIDYLGVSDDVRPHIAASDCVVLPSYREGTPRTLLEAAAMARPLIATDVPGCREVVDHGENGYLCLLKSAEDLAARMTDFIALSQGQRSAMGASSRAKAEREFDERLVIAAYLEHIARALARS